MNKTLFKATLKQNYKLLLIFFAILMMYYTIIISIYDPTRMDAWDAMLELFPEEIIKAMGFEILEGSFVGFIAGYYYGFIMLLFPLIYVCIAAYRSIAKYVDNGSMAFLLATPNTRQKIAITQGLYLLCSTLFLIVLVALMGGIVTEAMFPGELEVGRYMLLNLGVLLLFSALSGIGFFASCLFNEAKYALGFGVGVPVFFFVVDMLAGVSEDLSILRFATIYSLFDAKTLINPNINLVLHFGLLIAISVILYISGIVVFKRKNMHL